MRNVIVTGGSRGLGLGVARALRRAGYSAIAVARTRGEALDAAMREDIGSGAIHFQAFDLSDTTGIPALVKSIRKQFGSIYGLVNNAGVGTSGLLARMPDEDIERVVRLNTVSPIVLTKYVVRAMMADGGAGRIVNVASIVATTGHSGLAVYGATKSSLVGFTRAMAREVGSLGITVNAVAPGYVDTDMTAELVGDDRERVVRRSALKRLVDIGDVASAVEFLLGDGAKNITGTTITVDAGATA
ncbi:MAG: SDR family NAD(P)-dependent oxidoreductase [Gemmatimonadaceae bacterium]